MQAPENTQARNALIERDYVDDGLSLREIAAARGVSFQRIHQILTARGVVMRPQHVTRASYNYEGRR